MTNLVQARRMLLAGLGFCERTVAGVAVEPGTNLTDGALATAGYGRLTAGLPSI